VADHLLVRHVEFQKVHSAPSSAKIRHSVAAGLPVSGCEEDVPASGRELAHDLQPDAHTGSCHQCDPCRVHVVLQGARVVFVPMVVTRRPVRTSEEVQHLLESPAADSDAKPALGG